MQHKTMRFVDITEEEWKHWWRFGRSEKYLRFRRGELTQPESRGVRLVLNAYENMWGIDWVTKVPPSIDDVKIPQRLKHLKEVIMYELLRAEVWYRRELGMPPTYKGVKMANTIYLRILVPTARSHETCRTATDRRRGAAR